jgi:hypothetical protein
MLETLRTDGGNLPARFSLVNCLLDTPVVFGFVCQADATSTLSIRSTDLAEPFKYNIFKNLPAKKA